MICLEKAAEQLKNNMYNNTLGVSAYVQQPVCDPPVQSTDQHDTNAGNHTQLPYHSHFNNILQNTLHGPLTQMTQRILMKCTID